ncbi:ubiquitin-like-specific protease ESD4-like, partial [Trifolium medium]|nr:ubiquitin-like-specific protease ESD4-like [Trifolium medium]
MLTYDAKKETSHPKNWFLPTTLSQFVSSFDAPVEKMRKYYQQRFMGNADVISKIFIPVHDMENFHWYLLVIDFERQELVYLDSYRNSSVVEERMTSIKIL